MNTGKYKVYDDMLASRIMGALLMVGAVVGSIIIYNMNKSESTLIGLLSGLGMFCLFGSLGLLFLLVNNYSLIVDGDHLIIKGIFRIRQKIVIKDIVRVEITQFSIVSKGHMSASQWICLYTKIPHKNLLNSLLLVNFKIECNLLQIQQIEI